MIQRVQKAFNSCIRGLIIRFSFAFPIIIVMRFATFVAFMLPLAAFAAPTPTPRAVVDLPGLFNNEIGNYSMALGNTQLAIAQAVNLLVADNSQELWALDALTNARDNLFSLEVNLANLGAAVQTTTFIESEYVDSFTHIR